MAYIPDSNSVVSFQAPGSVLVASVFGQVGLTNFPTTQNVSGSVAAWLQSTNASVITVGTPVANQSVSGTVNVGNFPGITSLVSTVPSSVIVGASIFGNAPVTVTNTPAVITNNASVIAVVQGSVATAIVSGSIAASFTPPANQSVSGTVDIGIMPGSVAAFIKGNASIITVSQSSTAVAIVSGSIAASFTPPANQSVSGTVDIGVISGSMVAFQGGTQITSLVSTVPSSVIVGASIFGLPPVNVTNTVAVQTSNTSVISYVQNSVATVIIGGSIATSLTPPANQSVSGTVDANILNTNLNVSGSVASFPRGTIITSLVSTVPSSVIVGASIFGLAPVNVTNTNLNVSGSVASYPLGTIVTSLVSTVPSSVIVGASIFGLAPVNVTNTNINVSGSVAALLVSSVYGNISGSVAAFQGGTWATSMVGAPVFAEDAGHTTADKGIFVLGVRNDQSSSLVSADLDYAANALDSTGRTIIKPFVTSDHSSIINFSGSVTSTSVTLIAASTTGLKSYVTDFWVTNTGSVATLVTWKDGSTSILGQTIAPAGGGSNAPGIAVPMVTKAATQDLTFQAGTATSILYIQVHGYKGQ